MVSTADMANKSDVIIGIGADVRDLQNVLKQARTLLRLNTKIMNDEVKKTKLNFFPEKQQLRTQIADIKSEMNKLAFTQNGTRRASWTKNAQYQRLENSLQKANIAMYRVQTTEKESIKNIKEKWSPTLKKQTVNVLDLEDRLDGLRGTLGKQKDEFGKMGNEMKRGAFQFQGWAMSIMFFGMAMQRAFTTIWKQSTRVFNDVMHSVEGTVTNTDMLKGSFTYLGFVIGQALDPLLGFFIPIVDKVAELANQFPKTTAAIVAGGAALGTLFLVGGSGTLALYGFLELAANLGLAKKNADGLIKMDWANFGKTIQSSIGAISIFYALVQAKDAFDDFKEGKFSNAFFNALSSAALAVGGIRLFKGAKGGVPLMLIGVGLELLAEDKFFTAMGYVVGLFSAFGMTLRDALLSAFREGFSTGLANVLIDALFSTLKVLPSGILFDPIIGELKSATKALLKVKDTTSDFNFGESFYQNYVGQVAAIGSYDEAFRKMKNKFDSDVGRAQAAIEAPRKTREAQAGADLVDKAGDTVMYGDVVIQLPPGYNDLSPDELFRMIQKELNKVSA